VEAAADIELIDELEAGDEPTGVAVGADGVKYVTNLSSGTITVIDADGSTDTIAVGGSPYGIAVGADGKVYVTDLAGTVSVLDPDNDYSSTPFVSLAAVAGITVDDEDRLYIGNGMESTVTVFNSDGSVFDTIALDTPGVVAAVAVASDGSLYAVLNDSMSANTLVRVTPEGVVETVELGYAVNPFGVAVTADGVVYVTDVTYHQLVVLHPEAGEFEVNAGVYPFSVAVGADGRIYVTDFAGGTLKVLAPLPVTATVPDELG
jgi:YVTN family beta-propeller protein